MSKQELLSWTSLATTSSVLVFYFLIVFGWPDFLPDYSDRLVKIFFNLFWLAVIVEIFVEIRTKKKTVDKDERDFMIEAYGLRYAYNFLVTVLVILLSQLILSSFMGGINERFEILSRPEITIHVIFLVLLMSGSIKRITMIYHYRQVY